MDKGWFLVHEAGLAPNAPEFLALLAVGGVLEGEFSPADYALQTVDDISDVELAIELRSYLKGMFLHHFKNILAGWPVPALVFLDQMGDLLVVILSHVPAVFLFRDFLFGRFDFLFGLFSRGRLLQRTLI